MIRWLFMFVFLAAAALGDEPAAKILTLEQAISMTLSGNRGLASLELDLNGRALSAERARYQFAFNLYPVAGATASSASDNLRYGLVGAKELPVGTKLEAGVRVEENHYDNGDPARAGIAHVLVTQPLFRDWGTLINRENIVEADNQVVAGRRLLELRKSDLIVQVVETCQGLLRLKRLMEDEQRTIDRYDNLYRLTKAREKQGRATQVDGLRVALLKGQAESSLAASREELRSLQADFSELLGAEPNQYFMPEDTVDLRLAIPERDDALKIALQNRLDYAQALQDKVDAQRGVRIARKQLQPRVSLFGRYEKFGNGSDWNDAWAFNEDGWSVGLVSDSDLLMRDERLGVRQAALEVDSMDLRIEEVDALIRRQIDQALSDCRRAESEQEMAQKNVEVASRRATLAQRLFEKGRVDHTSATDAEIELLDARTTWLNTRAEAVIAGYRLLRMMGMLVESPAELKPPAG